MLNEMRKIVIMIIGEGILPLKFSSCILLVLLSSDARHGVMKMKESSRLTIVGGDRRDVEGSKS